MDRFNSSELMPAITDASRATLQRDIVVVPSGGHSAVLLSVVAIAAGIILWQQFHTRPRKYNDLPGPWSKSRERPFSRHLITDIKDLPFIGRVHDVDPTKPWFKQAEWCSEYGGIYQTTIMGEKHIWIGSQQIAYDLLAKRAPLYSSRPPVPAVPGSASLPHYLPLMAYGEAWKRHRKLAQVMLSMAHHNQYYSYVDFEAKRFLFELTKTPSRYYDLISRLDLVLCNDFKLTPRRRIHWPCIS